MHTIYTYNGSRFDLPFTYGTLGIDLSQRFSHHDLIDICWQKNLYAGLNSVERELGIGRRLHNMNGFEAVKL